MQSSGIVHVNLGDNATGCAKLKIALQQNPNSATTCAQLAYGLGTMGNYEEGQQEMQKARELVPQFTLEAVTEVVSFSARSAKMREFFEHLLEQIWSDDTLNSA
jgi:cytochrome c-type biogenesis protein CcmH/NrfG